MQFKTIFRVLGLLLMVFSLSMLPPAAVALWYKDGALWAFIEVFFITLVTGAMLWVSCRHAHKDLKTREGFLIVVLFWTVLSFFGGLPFIFAHHPHASFTDAMFEAMSGLTTTGTNVFSGIDFLPHAIRFYRQQLQFLGGMGIIVLAVAILPMLGVGGMQLYRAETPGPIKDTKLAPRITETAKTLWYIYIALTIACALSYWLAGMTPFDAIGESFATVATGGFSVHDSSFAFYDSNTIDMIASFFMLLGATNFGLHYMFLGNRKLSTYWQDRELRAFLLILLVAIVLITAVLITDGIYKNDWSAIVDTIFTVVSLGTTTGFVTARFDTWPTFIPYLIMIIAMIGGCAASTSGGVKVIRVLLLKKQGFRELKRLLHPTAVIPLKFGGKILSNDVIQAIWGFVSVFILVFAILFLVLLATGLNVETAFGAVAACLSNAGASIGNVAVSFESISPTAKWTLIFAMLAGRLEIFSLLVLFTPTFWRK